MRKFIVPIFMIGLFLLTLLSGCGGSPIVAREFTADADTIALWHFNETSGTTVSDSSAGHNHALTLMSDAAVPVLPTFVASGRSGFGNCISFLANNKQYCFGNSSPLSPLNNQISVEFWINFSIITPGVAEVIFGGNDNCDLQVWLYQLLNNQIEIFYGSAIPQYSVAASTTVTYDAWHYIAFTFNLGTDKAALYIDGVLNNYQPCPAAIPSPISYTVGGTPSQDYYIGLLDEMRVSSKARTASEIQAYYAQATK